jgi:hypothetical protein
MGYPFRLTKSKHIPSSHKAKEVGRAMNRRALEGYEKVLGLELPSTLTSISNLASVLRDQRRYDEAAAMNRALGGREKVSGVEHPDTLTC